MAKYKIIPSSRTIVQSPISIGHKAEKGVEAIEFDLTAWVETYGSGTLTVIMQKWGDAIPYPIALEIDENNKATWTLSDIDTAKAGMAYAQLSYIVGDTVVKKSDIYTFRVMDSLTGEGDPPEAYESWLEHLTHFAAEAMAEVLDIEGIVTDKTLTVDGGIADAKATGEALAEKVDAADYSELSARVGANTIALAEKADRSTTYTKTEVDQMIEDVEVETDTTLTISGAPADAKATGDALSALEDAVTEETDKLKADLGSYDDKISAIAEYKVSENLADPDNLEAGSILSDGSYDDTSKYKRSIDFIAAKPNTVYSLKYVGYVAEYREDKTFIKRVSLTNTSTYSTFTTNTNTAYIKLTGSTNPVKYPWRCNEGSDLVDEDYEPSRTELNENLYIRTVMDETLESEDKAAPAKTVGDALALKANLSDLDDFVLEPIYTRYFELGNILMNTEWGYSNSTTRIRTKRGVSFHVSAGTKLGLTDYESARYYLGWRDMEGTYSSSGRWLREDFVTTVEGDYVIIISAVPEMTVSDVSDLSSLVFGFTTLSQAVEDLHDGFSQAVEDLHDEISSVSNSVSKIEPLGILLAASPQRYPEFSSSNNTLTIFADTLLLTRTSAGYVQMVSTDTEIDMSVVTSSAKKIFYNLTSGEFHVKAYSKLGEEDDVLICSVRRSQYNTYVSMSCPYFVDGQPFGLDFDQMVSDGIVRSGIKSHVKAINHRGYYDAPENTMPAFKESVLLGFKYVETDVMFTSDNVPVLLHDNTINRTARNADGTEISTDIDIETITYTDLLQYDFGIWKDAKYAGTKIPTLEEFFVFCRNTGLHPYVEIKATKKYTEAQIQSLVDLAKRCGLRGKMSWTSMSETYLGYIASYDPTARIGLVAGGAPNVQDAISLRTGTNDVFFSASKTITQQYIEDCIDADVPLEIWTTDSISDITGLHPYVQAVVANHTRADVVLLDYALNN